MQWTLRQRGLQKKQRPFSRLDLADVFAFEQNRRLGRGVNLGNALEAPNEGEWGMTLEAEFFRVIYQGGFDSVRVPIRWSNHAASQPPLPDRESVL